MRMRGVLLMASTRPLRRTGRPLAWENPTARARCGRMRDARLGRLWDADARAAERAPCGGWTPTLLT
jgi:hypothetical protein